MYQVEIKKGNKQLKIIISHDASAYLKNRFTTPNELKAFLAQLSLNLLEQRKLEDKSIILIDSLFLPLFMNTQKVCMHSITTSEKNYHDCQIKEDISYLPESAVTEFALNKITKPKDCGIDILDGSDNNDFDTNAFRSKFSIMHIHWLTMIAPLLPQSLPPNKGLPPEDRSEAESHEVKAAASFLCEKLHHSELAEHICGQRNIADTISDTWNLVVRKTISLNEWLEQEIIKSDSETVCKYIEAQKAHTKRALIDAIKHATDETQQALFAQFNNDYVNHIEAVNRTGYLKLEGQAYLIKMNILIALYNAAGEYYQFIWQSCLNDPKKLTDKIHEFNRQFMGVARINLSSMQLTPITDACLDLRKLTLSEFEEKVGNIINESKISNTTLLRNHQEAFVYIQKHLNALQQAQDIYAPGEGNRLSIMIRPLKKIYGVATFFDAVDTLKTFILSEGQIFTLKPEVKELEQQILARLEEIKPAIENLHRFLSTLQEDARVKLQPDRNRFVSLFEHANYNIAAYSDLQQKSNIILANINKQKERITQTAEMIRNGSAQLHDLSYNLADLKIDVDTRTAISHESDHDVIRKNLADAMASSKTIEGRLAAISESLQTLVANSNNTETLWLQEFKYKHTDLIQTIESNFAELRTDTKQLELDVNATLRQLTITEKLIEACQAYKNISSAIDEFANKFNVIKANAINESAISDILEVAEETFNTLHRDTKKLADKTGKPRLLLEVNHSHQVESKTSQLLLQFKNEINTRINEIHREIDAFNKDYAKILLCHMAANAILNFPHWQARTGRLESTATMHFGNKSFRLPKSICKLARLIKEKRFDDWKVNPAKAELLLNAIKQASHKNRLFSNEAYKQFQQVLQNLNIHHVNNLASLTEKRRSINLHAGSDQHPVTVNFVTPFKLGTMRYTPGFRKRNPILANLLIGAGVTLALIGITALILTLIAFSGGSAAIAITAAAASFVALVGSQSIALGLMGLFAGIATAIGGLLGGLAGKHIAKHQHHKTLALAAANAALAAEPEGQIFGSSRKVIAQFERDNSPPTITPTSTNPFDPVIIPSINTTAFEDDDFFPTNPFGQKI